MVFTIDIDVSYILEEKSYREHKLTFKRSSVTSKWPYEQALCNGTRPLKNEIQKVCEHRVQWKETIQSTSLHVLNDKI